jgi:hypothetical protein
LNSSLSILMWNLRVSGTQVSMLLLPDASRHPLSWNFLKLFSRPWRIEIGYGVCTRACGSYRWEKETPGHALLPASFTTSKKIKLN